MYAINTTSEDGKQRLYGVDIASPSKAQRDKISFDTSDVAVMRHLGDDKSRAIVSPHPSLVVRPPGSRHTVIRRGRGEAAHPYPL
ncbi:hypothetical protein J6590_088670 [Homalodisca vitripennis]|nr:hypothetical protein J6590_088670 [Homalodisca vitripennis]